MTEENLKQIKLDNIYISRSVSLDTFKEKILNIKKTSNFYKQDSSLGNIRLFKLQNISWEAAIEVLIENNQAIRESKQLVKYDKVVYLEGIKKIAYYYIYCCAIFINSFNLIFYSKK